MLRLNKAVKRSTEEPSGIRISVIKPFLFVLLLACCLGGCAITGETLHGNTPVPNLSDQQLIQELASINMALGKKFNEAEFLIAIKPEPAYVLTSSYTSFSGTYTANMTTYTMPRGYHSFGSGTLMGRAVTDYSYQDQNGFATGLILLAQLINESKTQRLQERGYLILTEFRARAEERRRKTEKAIEQFFQTNPDLSDRKTLIAAILPWVAARDNSRPDDEVLQEAGNIARQLRTPTEKDFSDMWFGTFSQIDKHAAGTHAWSNFVVAKLHVVGDVLTGKAMLGAGETVSIQGTVKEGKFRGVTINETGGGATFECTGTISDTELAASYTGNAWGRKIEGTAVLLR